MNWRTGRSDSFSFGAGIRWCRSILFVPKRANGDERDSWLVGVTLNARERATEMHVFDTARGSATAPS
jgi:carotenoid cleavage dioxygenase-like enzyme